MIPVDAADDEAAAAAAEDDDDDDDDIEGCGCRWCQRPGVVKLTCSKGALQLREDQFSSKKKQGLDAHLPPAAMI